MGLLKKKCEYCKNKIDRGSGVSRCVKVPAFIGKRQKNFCCEGHADNYEKEVEEHIKNSKSCGGCCG